MKVAIVGFVQSGKSTLLAGISSKDATPSGGARIEEAIVPVPDERLDWLDGLYRPKKVVHATIDCLDVPGFSFVDSAGRAAARRLITQIRTVDMFVLVVRAFRDEAVPPYRGRIDPVRDTNELHSELLLADLELVTTRIEKLEKQVQKAAKSQQQDKEELALQLKLREALEAGRPAGTVLHEEHELELVRSLGFLTLKPTMVVINADESGGEEAVTDLRKTLDSSVPVIQLSAKIEQELAQLDPESRREFMSELGIAEPATSKFVRSCYDALGLISFLTVGPDEVRAWPIRKGSSALDAAGKIHSDIKRGFIRAETMSYDDLRELGEEKLVRAAGKFRQEGKTYPVQDGDIINFKFNI